MFESRISAGATDKLQETKATRKPDAETISSWSCANLQIKTTEQFNKVATSCMDDHHFKKKKMGLLELLTNYSEMSFLARIGRPDIPWSVNKLARAVTKLTRSCDNA